MTEIPASLPREWRYGIHPAATGTTIRSLGRIDLPVGEALRLEMVNAGSGDETVHVQVYICTEAGGWALWISCARADLADLEAPLYAMTPPVS